MDFVELGLAARQVLRTDEGESSELADVIAERWPHLLVDEFQDTSRSQYELLTLIASGWESAGRGSCFLVGDPMQSIYMFRQAEVELFERTKRYGLGEGTATVHLTPLQLQTNFRSHAGLVDRLNEIFEQIFEPATGQDYQVDFRAFHSQLPSATRQSGRNRVALFQHFQTQHGGKALSGRYRSPARGQHHPGALAGCGSSKA